MRYIVISTVSLSFLYILYRILFKNETNFKQLRIYLLLSIIISLLLPLNNFEISFQLLHSQTINIPNVIETNNNIDFQNNDKIVLETGQMPFYKTIDWIFVIRAIYFLVAFVLLIRVLIQIIVLIKRFLVSVKIHYEGYTLIYNHGFKNSFSFFKWIFISENENPEEDIQKVITHEIVHAAQFHTFDLIVIELITVIMWFNPVVWMMKKSIQLVHEYLADEGVLSSGIKKANYQHLLINHIAEEKLIHIASSFNQSLIKKRIIMMNNEKITRKSVVRLLMLIPVTILLFLSISCVNSQSNEKNDVVAAIAPTKMNVMYLGIENPINIAISGYESSALKVEIPEDEGSIKGENGNYIVIPKKAGLLTVTVKAKNEKIKEAKFRVKSIPQPFAVVNRQRGGEITKQDLLKQKEIFVFLENFDFDVKFDVTGFDISTVNDEGYTISASSESNKITQGQLELIKSAKSRSKIIFDNIKAKGPDGSIKSLSPLVFTLE